MKTILQQYPKSSNLFLNDATNVTEYRPLWRLMSTFGAYALLAVHARNEWMKL